MKHGPTLTELAYLAGFLDGEGCFQWNANATPSLTVTNTYLDACIRLYRAWGGSIYKAKEVQSTHRQRYQWYCYGDTACAAAEAAMPYLIEKRRQAQIMIRARDYQSGSRQREYLIKKLKALKHKVWVSEDW